MLCRESVVLALTFTLELTLHVGATKDVPGPPTTQVRKTITIDTDPRGTVSVFDKPDYEGTEMSAMLTTDCVNIHQKFWAKVQSIDTLGHCVVIFDTRQCQGDGYILVRHSREAKRIVDHMGQNPRSVRLCNHEDNQIMVFYPEESTRKEKWPFALFRFPYSGQCVNIPKYVSKEAVTVGFIGPLPRIVLYERPGCEGRPMRVSPVSLPYRGSTFRSGRDAAVEDNLHLLYIEALPSVSEDGGGDTSATTTTSKNAQIDLATGQVPGAPSAEPVSEPELDDDTGESETSIVDRVGQTVPLPSEPAEVRGPTQLQSRSSKDEF